jgi:hypothetical protein
MPLTRQLIQACDTALATICALLSAAFAAGTLAADNIMATLKDLRVRRGCSAGTP